MDQTKREAVCETCGKASEGEREQGRAAGHGIGLGGGRQLGGGTRQIGGGR